MVPVLLRRDQVTDIARTVYALVESFVMTNNFIAFLPSPVQYIALFLLILLGTYLVDAFSLSDIIFVT